MTRWRHRASASAGLMLGAVVALVGCSLGRDDGGTTATNAPTTPGAASTLSVVEDLVDAQVVTWRSWRAVEETMLEFSVTAGPVNCYGAHTKVVESDSEVRVQLQVGRLPEAADRQCPAIALESVVPVRLATPLGARQVKPLT